MNSQVLEGKWDQLKGKVKEQWGKLTDNDIMIIKGQRDKLVGKVKEKYGYTKEKAETEVERFLGDCGCAEQSANPDRDSEEYSRRM